MAQSTRQTGDTHISNMNRKSTKRLHTKRIVMQGPSSRKVTSTGVTIAVNKSATIIITSHIAMYFERRGSMMKEGW